MNKYYKFKIWKKLKKKNSFLIYQFFVMIKIKIVPNIIF